MKMVESKKKDQVKSFWITATSEDQTSLRICSAKFKEERASLEKKMRTLENLHQRILKVEDIISSIREAPTEKTSGGGGGGGGGSRSSFGFLGLGGGSSSSSSSGTDK